ncbi:unnamed protein product [Peniophora sp. CBMAI 1063]|nr:unnamed protein product [Peniophora sp. CBMAI 1063]
MSHSHFPPQQAQKRPMAYNEPNFRVPIADENIWYYPRLGDSDEEDNEEQDPVGPSLSNWGKKHERGTRFMRKGKLAAWGPGLEDWEAEERARKRVKLMMPREEERSPSPPLLPHLRSPSPPSMAPYNDPSESVHHTYTSFVMDSAVVHTFRSTTLSDLERTTNGLIEGETALRRALGKLWHALSGADARRAIAEVVPKREDEEDAFDVDALEEERINRAPNLEPASHRLLVYPEGPGHQPMLGSREMQMDRVDKSLSTLRDLEGDTREFVERLEEVRESLGEIRATRDHVWYMVRTHALEELEAQAAEAEGL